jgi:hypothetical protein
MARWTGDPHIGDVLTAGDAWRERCFLNDGSILSDEPLWTADNFADLKRRLIDNPIPGTEQDFYEKFRQQLRDASQPVIRLAAESVWFYLLFPHHNRFGPDKKIEQVKQVWEWAGMPPPDSDFLDPSRLMGVGHPGTAYLTRRPDEFGFLFEVMTAWKGLPPAERNRLMTDNAPWNFVEWIDTLPGADRRPMRNAILYFLFPDDLERNISNEHRRQIVSALKDKIPPDSRPPGKEPSLLACDKAINALRGVFEQEIGTTELDFYRPPIQGQWWITVRDRARTAIASEIKNALSNYGLELRQCGSKKKRLENCYPVDEATGFWANPAEATNKPLRWFLHLTLEGDQVVATLPAQNGNKRIAFANTAQGTSGAVTTRVVPVIRIAPGKFAFYETWEWMLLLSFYPALEIGSSGQLFEDFDPATGGLTYMGKRQPYIAAALITLNEEDDVFMSPDLPRPIRYGEATAAIGRLIQVDPTDMTIADTETTNV